MTKEVRIAFVGLGARGLIALKLMLPVPHARVVALCDATPEGVDAARAILPHPVRCYVGKEAYLEACRDEEADLIYICSNWQSHTAIALAGMRAGKHVAVEVPAATTLDDIHSLIAETERSGLNCFLLENCCYDPAIETAIADVLRGDIGEPVHAEGSYYHHLGDRWTEWRLEMNRTQRGDLYPTHEMAPLCRALGIGTNDELQTLVAMDSAPFTGADIYAQATGKQAIDFLNGDHTTTLIRTRLGRTILLKHDVMNNQPYERMFRIIGTKGIREVVDRGGEGHDELTLRMNQHLIHQLSNGLRPDHDVYDLARWCSVIPLSCQSIEQGFQPVPFPEWKL